MRKKREMTRAFLNQKHKTKKLEKAPNKFRWIELSKLMSTS